jgi:hypothetical protein
MNEHLQDVTLPKTLDNLLKTLFGVKKSMGADEITQATLTPLGDYLWGVYFGILNIFGIS